MALIGIAQPAGAAAQWSKARIGKALAPSYIAAVGGGTNRANRLFGREAELLATHASGKLQKDLVAAGKAAIAYAALSSRASSKVQNRVINAQAKTSTQLLVDLPALLAAETAAVATTTTSPPQTPAQIEATCTASPSYGDLTSPNAQSGVCVTYQAQIFQYDSNTGKNEMLVDVTNDGYGDWSNTVELQIPDSIAAMNFVQNDVIQFWGPTAGSDTYSTSIGGSNTVPVVHVEYATLISTG